MADAADLTPPPEDISPLPLELRREQVLALLADREYLRVSELVERFGVSEVTVRTDLERLAREGLVKRVRGGAVASGQVRTERSYEDTTTSHVAEKAAIGAAAARLVEDGESLLIDVGTTTTALARALAADQSLQNLTVFTNGLRIAAELERAVPRYTVVVTGGTLRPLQHSLVEPLASVVLRQIRPDVVFLGATAVTVEDGVTNVNLPEAGLKALMVSVSRRRILLADSSKLGRIDVARCCPLSDIDVLVTDIAAPGHHVQAFRDHGVDVVLADPHEPGSHPEYSTHGSGREPAPPNSGGPSLSADPREGPHA